MLDGAGRGRGAGIGRSAWCPGGPPRARHGRVGGPARDRPAGRAVPRTPISALVKLVRVLAGVLAVAGGGLVTTQVFSFVEDPERVTRAGAVLRGGAWIGALERLAVYAALVAGWAPGLAIVLAVKGLGRYPELRSRDDSARRRALHHRHLHQRALGRRLRRPRPPDPDALAQDGSSAFERGWSPGGAGGPSATRRRGLPARRLDLHLDRVQDGLHLFRRRGGAQGVDLRGVGEDARRSATAGRGGRHRRRRPRPRTPPACRSSRPARRSG